jgi:hypothetical protein
MAGMSSIRIIKHESVPQTGSYEVRFPDGRPSAYFYFDDNPGRRSITEKMTSAEALQAAKALARAEQDKFDSQYALHHQPAWRIGIWRSA